MTKLTHSSIFSRFFNSSSSSGLLLLFTVAVSLLVANSVYSHDFSQLLSTKLGYENDWLHLRYPLLLWINDGLMAVFFLLVGLEIKREVIQGELSSLRRAMLPVLAAIGGAVLPAVIYAVFNAESPEAARGWGIPMATDIAFALGVLSLLGKSVPPSLKIFLAALAIADDLIAILVIALFYSTTLQISYLLYAAAIFGLQLAFNRAGVKSIACYIIPGIVMWYFIHHSGVHATIAGVLTALTIPTSQGKTISPLEKTEHALSRPVNFLIMPLFALANTNITFLNGMVDELASNLSLGIILGLCFGKPIGIFLMAWLATKLKIAELPSGTEWLHIVGLGMLGGIGFTMSIFIALLSLNGQGLQDIAKFSILVASFISGSCGYMLLKSCGRAKNVT